MNKLLIASFLLALFITTPIHAEEKADEKRLDEVAERGAHVMPFDLEKTTHIFSKTDTGGIQQVIVKDKSDTCLLYTSPSPRDRTRSRMPSSA